MPDESQRRRRPWRWVAIAALLPLIVIAAALSMRRGAPPAGDVDISPLADSGARAEMAQLAPAVVRAVSDSGLVTIDLPPVDLPARQAGQEEPMVVPPVVRVGMPVTGYITKYHVEVLDSTGRRLPQTLLHHFNLNDPDHRELFLPILLHILAASRETPTAGVPWLLFGVPVSAGQQFMASGMLANTGPTPYHAIRIRLVLRIRPAHRPWPLFRGYPWVIDVQFPLGRQPGGSKAFDLPPGRSEHSFESSPAVPGTIIGMGGHLHDFGVSLELKDLTTGEVLGRAVPIRDSIGHVITLPLVRFYRWNRLGIHVTPAHRYRVTVVYDNPTGERIPDGGMGALAGLFIPDAGTIWPRVNPADTLYQQDLYDELHAGAEGMHMHMHADAEMPMDSHMPMDRH
jgi:hypothetical protein